MKVLNGIGAALLVLAVTVGVWIYTSPMPGVYYLRYGVGDGEVSYPSEEVKRECMEAVEVMTDLTYMSEDENNTYDLYLPKQREGKLPVIFWVHGGAFVAGDNAGVANWAYMLAREGAAVVTVDYQWVPEITYPGQTRQVEECILEVMGQAEELQLDTDRVVLAGDSAGAHLAAQCALLATNPEYEEVLGIESVLDTEDLKAVLLYCGPYDVSKMMGYDNKILNYFVSTIGWSMFGEKDWQQSEMLNTTAIVDYLTEDFPPAFVTDGNTGSFEEHGKELAAALDKLGITNHTLFFNKYEKEVGHVYEADLKTEEAMKCFNETMDFLRELEVM